MRWGVLIPVFNAADTLETTLESVVNQELTPDSICLVNDGSTDSSGVIMKRYVELYTNLNWLIVEQENAGLGAARNAGIAALQTEYIALLDADDVWTGEKLEHCEQFLRRHPDTDLLYHPVWEWNASTGRKRKRRDRPVETIKDLWNHNPITPSASVMRRDFMNWRFPVNRNEGVEDVPLWSEAMSLGAVVRRMPKCDTFYRINHGMSFRLEEHEAEVWIAIEGAVEKGWLKQSDLEEIRCSRAYLMGRARHKQGAFRAAIQSYRKSGSSVKIQLLRILAGLHIRI